MCFVSFCQHTLHTGCNIANDWHSNGAVAVNFLRFNIQLNKLCICRPSFFTVCQ